MFRKYDKKFQRMEVLRLFLTLPGADICTSFYSYKIRCVQKQRPVKNLLKQQKIFNRTKLNKISSKYLPLYFAIKIKYADRIKTIG
jgi:hypothetical protein